MRPQILDVPAPEIRPGDYLAEGVRAMWVNVDGVVTVACDNISWIESVPGRRIGVGPTRTFELHEVVRVARPQA